MTLDRNRRGGPLLTAAVIVVAVLASAGQAGAVNIQTAYTTEGTHYYSWLNLHINGGEQMTGGRLLTGAPQFALAGNSTYLKYWGNAVQVNMAVWAYGHKVEIIEAVDSADLHPSFGFANPVATRPRQILIDGTPAAAGLNQPYSTFTLTNNAGTTGQVILDYGADRRFTFDLSGLYIDVTAQLDLDLYTSRAGVFDSQVGVLADLSWSGHPIINAITGDLTVGVGEQFAYQVDASNAGLPLVGTSYAWDLTGEGWYEDAYDWASGTWSFDTPGERTLGVRVTNGYGFESIETFTVNVVPEPGTGALLGLGVVGALAGVRRRRPSL